MNSHEALTATLLNILDGCTHAAVMMPWGKPGPIQLPDEPAARTALVEAHIEGRSATVTYCPSGKSPRSLELRSVVLYAYCPAADGLCRWIGVDLDATDGHGAGGLVDTLRAAACIAERCDAAGLLDGLIVARSGGGKGRHLWLSAPEPVSLEDAVLVVAGLAARAARISDQDASDTDRPHAYLCGDGTIAILGQSGSVELIPRSTERPALGWCLLLPSPGAWADRDGGVIVNPFTLPPAPAPLQAVPRCNADAWQTFLKETRHELSRRQSRNKTRRSAPHHPSSPDLMKRLDPRTHVFLDGRCPPGQRNQSLYIAVRNMLGVGIAADEAKQLALQGALACGLSQREAQATIRSALRTKGIL